MPTVLREAGWRFYFYSHEPNEPVHIHVDKAGGSAKIWLTPVSVARSLGLSAQDLAQAVRLVRTRQEELREAWHGYFGRQDG
jgi:hypothetical protein